MHYSDVNISLRQPLQYDVCFQGFYFNYNGKYSLYVNNLFKKKHKKVYHNIIEG